jgi:hypothetical protein
MNALKIKETKYLVFMSEQRHGQKTKTVHVINKSNTQHLASIEWYGAWRQYCFMPATDISTVWNIDCLTDINSVITKLMRDRKIERQNED